MLFSIDNLIEATGWSIVHSLWMGALAYGLLLLLFAAFPDSNARTRYAFSFSSLVLLFMGFIAVFFGRLEFSYGSKAVQDAGFYFPVEALVRLGLPKNPTPAAFNYLVGGYHAGLCLQVILLCLGYFRIRRMRHIGLLAVPSAWASVFSNTLLRMGIAKPVGFRLSGKVKMPLVVGYLKPMVLFPLAMANHLDTTQVEAILIHELSHVRRNDYLLNLFKTMMETVLFFNPFVWLIGRIINQERENACDDIVLQQTGKPIFYAQTLLQVALLTDETGGRLAMAATGKTKSQLFQRIERITNMKTKYINIRQQLLVLAFAALATASLAWIGPKGDLEPDNKNEQSHEYTEATGMDTSHVVKLDAGKQVDSIPNNKRIVILKGGEHLEYHTDSLQKLMDTLKMISGRRVLLLKDNDRAMIDSIIANVHKNYASKYRFFETDSVLVKRLKGKTFHMDSLAKTIQKMHLDSAMKFHFDMRKDSMLFKLSQKDFAIDSIWLRNVGPEFKMEFNGPVFDGIFMDSSLVSVDSLYKNSRVALSMLDGKKMKFPESVKGKIIDFVDPELYNSPEYKVLREKFEKDVEKLRQKKQDRNN
ncbi:M56 family metallopeptidase [Parapedobacter tibetensis]|uniref:M56 family metallopeptidase n=1 Tax=Parapedobacter tibetensis TaxID=2972951 RepID=UPI00214D73DB|nr:M56 family metallopeptidase [Parapedobacter tibetensis]